MTRIIMECLPTDAMRLPAYGEEGCGDWFFDGNGDLHIQVCGPDVWDHVPSFLVALHELVEARLCFAGGITQGSVDAFDQTFSGEGEPGDDAAAPYRRQHREAMLIEATMAHFLGDLTHVEMF